MCEKCLKEKELLSKKNLHLYLKYYSSTGVSFSAGANQQPGFTVCGILDPNRLI